MLMLMLPAAVVAFAPSAPFRCAPASHGTRGAHVIMSADGARPRRDGAEMEARVAARRAAVEARRAPPTVESSVADAAAAAPAAPPPPVKANAGGGVKSSKKGPAAASPASGAASASPPAAKKGRAAASPASDAAPASAPAAAPKPSKPSPVQDYGSMTVVFLKEELRERGLKLSGKKVGRTARALNERASRRVVASPPFPRALSISVRFLPSRVRASRCRFDPPCHERDAVAAVHF